MSPLQKTGHRDSPYERPNQTWVCGWTADGDPCRMGPDSRGRCTAGAQSLCAPRKEGDRYFCTRPAVFGGTCAAGPLPDGGCPRPEPTHPICQPRLSLRARRGRLVIGCVSLALGLIVLALTGPWGLRVISPGGLSSAHRGLAGPHAGMPGCASCHSAADGGAGGLIAAAFSSGTGLAESRKCLDCHFKKNAGTQARALLVHGADPGRLAEKTAALKEKPAGSRPPLAVLAALAGQPPQNSSGEIACATCHHEHRGREHDLTQIGNISCQTCHAMKFAGFTAGHPEFEKLSRTEAVVRFDHFKHAQPDHFGDTPFACSRCHTPIDGGRSLRLESFSIACSGCHDAQGKSDHHGEQIRANSLTLIQLPAMTFAGGRVDWPREAARGEAVTQMVRLLLLGDADALPALKNLADSDVDWTPGYWEPAEPGLKAALAAAIGRLVSDLVAQDHQAVGARVALALGAPPTAPEVTELVESLMTARFALLAYQRRWLPGLVRTAASGPGARAATSGGPDWTPPPGTSGWFVDPQTVAVAYRPAGHSDPFVRRLVEALAAHSGDSAGGGTEGGGDGNGAGPDEAEGFRRSLRAQIHGELTSKESGGPISSMCLRCHTLGRQEGGAAVVWRPAETGGGAHGYSKFDHRPHLALRPGAEGCRTCHAQGEPGGGTEALETGGFLPHGKAQCSECHAPGRVADACLTCHAYHFQRP